MHLVMIGGSDAGITAALRDRATGQLLGMQLSAHKNAEIARRIDIAATAIFHGNGVAVSHLIHCPRSVRRVVRLCRASSQAGDAPPRPGYGLRTASRLRRAPAR